MINWNPFKPKPKPVPMNGTTLQFYGPGSNNVQVIDLSGNGSHNVNGVQIVYGNGPQVVNQKIQGEVPMYGQGNNYGFVQAQPAYQNTPYQIPVHPSYQVQYNGANSYQINHVKNNQKKVQSSNLYPDLNEGNNSNPYGKYPMQQAKQYEGNPYVKEPAKGNQGGGNPYY